MFLYVFVAFSIHFLAASSPSFIIVHHFVLSFQLPNPIQPHPTPSNPIQPHPTPTFQGKTVGILQVSTMNVMPATLFRHISQVCIHIGQMTGQTSLDAAGICCCRDLHQAETWSYRNQISIFVRIFNKKKGCMMIWLVVEPPLLKI